MKKKGYHHQNLREDAITASVQLIEKEGVESFTLRKLAEILDVNHGALYHHFKDKDDILVEVAGKCFKDFTENVKLENEKFSDDPEKQFINYGHMYVNFAIENRNIFKLIYSNKRYDKKKYNHWKDVAASGLNYLLEIIKNCQKVGVIKKGSALKISLGAWSITHGLATLMTDERIDMLSDFGFLMGFSRKKILNIVTDTLLHGVMAKK